VLEEEVVLLIVVAPINVVAPVTPKVLESVVAPVTPNVPPTDAAPFTVKLASVEAPAVNVDEKVPAPETAKVFPSVVAPVTPSVPAITVLPLVAAIVNLLVLTATSPLTPNVPIIDVAPKVDAPADNVEEKVPAAALKLPVKLKEVPLAAPILGVIKVGVFERTKLPLPVEVDVPVPPFATAIVVPLQVP
jgi:hypothetical protein